MQRPVKIGLAFLTGIVGAALLLTAVTRLEQKDLISHATRITTTAGWNQTYGGYFWESPQTLFVAYSQGRNGLRTVRRNLTTGTETELTALNSQLNGMRSSLNNWRLSPNGKWLVFQRTRLIQNGRRNEWVATTLDGSQQRTWAVHGGESPLWYQDSHGWVEVAFDKHSKMRVGIHVLEGKDPEPVPVQGTISWAMGLNTEGQVVVMTPNPMVNSRFPLSSSPPAFRQANLVEFDRFALNNSPSQQTLISLPPDASRIYEAEFSPKGDYLAYLVRASSLSPIQRFLSRVWPFYRLPNTQTCALWISRTDGKEMHKIGSVEAAPNAGQMQSLLWTLDSKRLSFLYNNALYTVPAN